MNLAEFAKKVDDHPELCGEGMTEHAVVIRHTLSCIRSHVPFEEIERLSWEELEPILIGKRDPKVLRHMSRIVGYFSRIDNWNPSKIGELRDRHKGNYAVTSA